MNADTPQKYLVRSIEYLGRHHPRAIKARFLGRVIHRVICRYQKRVGSEYTRFFRNPPQLEVLRYVVMQKETGATLRISVLGCSKGAEMYSALSTIRLTRPDLHVVPFGLDISSSAIQIAHEGLYHPGSRELEGLSEEVIELVFDKRGNSLRVQEWVREGVSWLIEDARNPKLLETLGPQDIVMANNFLIHMQEDEAEACFLNIARLVVPGGHLFVWGFDLDVKSRLVCSLGLTPVRYNIENVYNADHDAHRVWPYKWHGLEPLDTRRQDWEIRYATVFQVPLHIPLNVEMKQ